MPQLIMMLLMLAAVCCGREGEGVVSENAPVEEPEIELRAISQVKQGPRYHERIRVNPIGSLREVFNDSNYLHYAKASQLGINPIESLHDAYFTAQPIVKIESCESYEVDELSHSVPYLVPVAANLLKDIGEAFIDTLLLRGGDGFKIIMTSALRTPSTVKRLRRVNRNATDSSTHMFGTTFDISWRRFACADSTRTLNEEDLKNVLAEVLLAKRNEGRCLVKYESKTACFHVTATK